MEDQVRVFSVAEFCERYGIGRTKAYEEMAEGRLRARRVGRRRIITQPDSEAWLERLPVIAPKGGG